MSAKASNKLDGACREVSNGRILLLMVPSSSQKIACDADVKKFLSSGGVMVYVSANKPYKTLAASFKKAKFNSKRVFFIDMISKTPGGYVDEKEKNCIFLDSPRNLTDLSIALSEMIHSLPPAKKIVMIDSVNTLMLYNDSTTVMRFLHFLSGRMRMWKIGGVLLAVSGETSEAVRSQLAQFCDKVVDTAA